MVLKKTIIPIYTTRGDGEAFLVYPYIFNRIGEWIGWVTSEREVYSVHGHYVGWITDDPRIIRRRAIGRSQHYREPPTRPRKLTPPARVPLAPLLPELPIGTFDVLEEEPELLPSLDYGELREDMD
jgi:hypothetical protein